AWWMTTQILLISSILCLAIGLLVGPLLNSKSWYVRVIPRIYVEVFRLTPVILQIVFFFLILPLQFNIRFNNLVTGIIALSLNYGAFASVIIQAGVGGVSKGQREAAQAMGMTRAQVMRRIVLPQAIQKMLSPFGSMLIYLNKDTSLLSVIGVTELFNVSQSVGARLFRNMEILIFIACLYLVINIPLAALSEYLNKKYNSDS
ncbi:MAG: amino acid ABC transporter permease, partial [Acidimicrobiaceae bacterium]|nr:amino acid ABC transporter permease [Acidimicrobiaceae bacterium]